MEGQGTFTIDQFREMKETGIDPYEALEQAEGQTDAASEQFEQEHTGVEDDGTPVDEQEEAVEPSEDDEPIVIPEEQKTAFQKALEREKRKAREEAQKRAREELETEFNPYKKFFDQLGIDPETAMKSLEQNKIRQEAEQLAYQNGWDDQQTEWYVRQQQLERDQSDMRVQLKVYELADSPDYPGIKAMKGQISELVRQNPRMSVEQAYWAVGGQPLAQQLKREAEQRQIAKRSQQKRTVVADSPTASSGPAPLTPEDVQFMRDTGMSESSVRQLKSAEFKTIEDYRKWKKTQGRNP